MPTPIGNGKQKADEIMKALNQLHKAAAPVLDQIRRTRPLISSQAARSPAFHAWSSMWQAEADAAIRCLELTLPEEANAAASAARNAG